MPPCVAIYASILAGFAFFRRFTFFPLLERFPSFSVDRTVVSPLRGGNGGRSSARVGRLPSPVESVARAFLPSCVPTQHRRFHAALSVLTQECVLRYGCYRGFLGRPVPLQPEIVISRNMQDSRSIKNRGIGRFTVKGESEPDTLPV